jgi:hypothetical protein
MQHTHDHAYKLLFSEPELIIDLLQGFVDEPWVADLDFTTLEPVSASYITDDLRSRESDVIWRVKHREQCVCLSFTGVSVDHRSLYGRAPDGLFRLALSGSYQNQKSFV